MNMKFQLLAKSEKYGDSQTLFEHTENVIKTVKEVYDNLPVSLGKMNSLFESAKIAALFHDFGKAHPEFQKLLKGEKNEWARRRHEVISAVFFVSILDDLQIISNDSGKLDSDINWKVGIWLAIILHHKSLYREFMTNTKNFLNYSRDIRKIPFRRENRIFANLNLLPLYENYSEMLSIIDILKQKHDLKFKTKLRTNKEDQIGIVLESFFYNLLKKHDSINLRDLLISQEQSKLLANDERWLFALLLGILKTSDHMASMGISPIRVPKLSKYKINKSLYPYQEKASQTANSLILRAPTAAGKTIAAFAWARNNQCKNGRLIYILPFQASINAMFKVFDELTKTKDKSIVVGINHAKNYEFLSTYFSDTDSDEQLRMNISPKDLKSLANEIFYPIKISTAHQLLRLLLFGKGWERVFIELFDSLVIFDEIHAYEPKILGLIVQLMKILRKINSKFLIMTATLPEFIIKLIKYHVFPDGDLTEIELSFEEIDDRSILEKKRHSFVITVENIMSHIDNQIFVDLIAERYKSNKKQLFVCNTILTAQKLINKLLSLSQFESEDLLLYHSRFTYRDRQKKEKIIFNSSTQQNKEIRILIATQVVEVSLNIDYEYGYFEICPIDALIQRMGRVNRFGLSKIDLSKECNIMVFTKTLYDNLIYDSSIVNRSLDVLQSREKRALTESELKQMVEEVYPTYSEEEWNEFYRGLNHTIGSNFEEKLEVGLQQEWILELIEDSDSKLEILPKELESEYLRLWTQKKYVEANMLLISVTYRHEWKNNLEDLNKRKYIKLLMHPDYSYDEKMGLRKNV